MRPSLFAFVMSACERVRACVCVRACTARGRIRIPSIQVDRLVCYSLFRHKSRQSMSTIVCASACARA